MKADSDQLKAGRDQSKADHDQFKADRDQSKTDHSQFKADRDQLKASHNQLKATNSQLYAGTDVLKGEDRGYKAFIRDPITTSFNLNFLRLKLSTLPTQLKDPAYFN